MSVPKFTPGPWVRRGADTYRWQIEKGGDVRTAICVARITTPKKGGSEASDANAALIAAAPEMHDAIAALLDEMLHVNVPSLGVLEQLRLALRKARGEQ